MKIAIIGAGISGLSAALALAKRGHQVEIFQREAGVGGLIGTFDFAGTRIEHFYHFLCAKDAGYFRLCEELGLAERLRFKKARTGFYYDGRLYPFGSALDLLRFAPIPFNQRIRFGIFALEAQVRQAWRALDKLRAKPWLIQRIGQRAYDVIWEPLLALKFGGFHEEISAAWVWHRIHRVARSKGRMGYLEGGTALLLDTLVARLTELGVVIHESRPVSEILKADRSVRGVRTVDGAEHESDAVVSTVPLEVLAGLLPPDELAYGESLRKIKYIGVVCLLFKLKRPVSNNFWLNVHDKRVPFNGIIEYTNLNPLEAKDGHIVYVPYYVATDHPYYTMNDDALITQSWEALKLIAPHLRDEDRIAHHVARAAYAQAICPAHFLDLLPKPQSPLGGLHLLDSVFLYPEDRTQSGHIFKAEECARRIGNAS